MEEVAEEVEPGSGDALVAPDLLPDLLPFLSEQISVYDRDGKLLARVGPPDGVLGHGLGPSSVIGAHCHPDDMPALIEAGAAVVDSAPGWCGSGRVRMQDSQGQWQAVELRAWNCTDHPRIAGYVVASRLVFEDVDTPVVAGVEREQLPSSLAAALVQASLLVTRELVVAYVTPAAESLLGRPGEELVGRSLEQMIAGPSRTRLLGALSELQVGEVRTVVCRFERPGAEDLVAEVTVRTGTRQPTSMFALSLTDRTTEPELVRLATRDPLTGVANRARALSTIAGHLAAGDAFAVFFADLDDLKTVNDRLGHVAGDTLITEVAERLEDAIGDEGMVARYGGDEFIVITPHISEPHHVDQLARRLRAEVRVELGGLATPVTVSVGAALAAEGDTPASLIGRADTAMFSDKRRATSAQSRP